MPDQVNDAGLNDGLRKDGVDGLRKTLQAIDDGDQNVLGSTGLEFVDDAATKLLYLVLNHAAAEWKRPPREWAEAKTQFAVMFNERFVNS